MVQFTDIPLDILLKCLLQLDVNDILCAERTCRHVHDVLINRHFWISKLNHLDQVCAPDLPECIDPTTLSYSELRSTVIRAFRPHYLMVNEPTPRVRYFKARTISISHSRKGIFTNDTFRVHSVKIVPGGRFLFARCDVVDCHGNFFEELRLLDLEDRDRCIWKLDYNTSWLGRNCALARYSFDLRQDGSVALALLTSITRTDVCRAIVFDLSPPVGRGTVQQILAVPLEFRRDVSLSRFCCIISGRFAAFRTTARIVVIVDCEEKKVAKFQFGSSPDHLAIRNDHLFFIDTSADSFGSLRSLSLLEAMTRSSSSHETVGIDTVPMSSFDPKLHVDEGLRHRLHSMAFSVYNHPTCRNLVAISMIGTIHAERTSHLLFSRVMFNPLGSGDSQWTHIGTRWTERYGRWWRAWDTFTFKSELSRSGRIILNAGPTGDVRLVTIDSRGDPIVRRLLCSDSSDPSALGTFLEVNVAERAEWGHPYYLEPYSNAMLRLSYKGRGKFDVILYRPVGSVEPKRPELGLVRRTRDRISGLFSQWVSKLDL